MGRGDNFPSNDCKILYNSPMVFSRLRRAPVRASRSAGFTLVELSVVIVIISIVAVSGLEVAASYMGRTAYQTTAAKLAVIDRAVAEYKRVKGYLPCPALPTMGPGNGCYGKGYSGSGACLPTACDADQMASNTVYFGDVPARDLGLSLEYVTDSYGSKFRYVVSKDLAMNATTYNVSGDALAIRSGKLGTNCGNTGDRCQSRGTAAYAVLSFGADRRGAYGPNGTLSACVPSPTGDYDGRIDTANCRMASNPSLVAGGSSVTVPANAFYDSRFNSGTVEENYFDDLIVWRSKGSL